MAPPGRCARHMPAGVLTCVAALVFVSGTAAVAQSTHARSSITGRVTDSKGSLVSGASVEARVAGSDDAEAVRARTDADGSYSVAVVSGVEYALSVEKEGYIAATLLVTPGAGARVCNIRIARVSTDAILLDAVVETRAMRMLQTRAPAPGVTSRVAAMYP
ncbi:MAG TPA: carboxypeptidase-like regulatory domain-containing protein, partial [Longimicrobium sp.]|nr:carboxypeptidase-like regulatory domain-containing protein [Longimicrobium sp.]